MNGEGTLRRVAFQVLPLTQLCTNAQSVYAPFNELRDWRESPDVIFCPRPLADLLYSESMPASHVTETRGQSLPATLTLQKEFGPALLPELRRRALAFLGRTGPQNCTLFSIAS